MNKKKDTVVVTGAAGFIGVNVVEGLKKVGYTNLLAVGTGSEQKCNTDILNSVEYMNSKIFLEKIQNDSLKNIGAIIHLGACTDTTERNEEYIKRNNVEYSKYIYEYCLRNNCQFIYASSAATYGDGSRGFDDDDRKLEPMNLYGVSKHLFDEWVRDNKETPSQCVGLKFFNVYGPHESHKGRMASMVYNGYLQVREKGNIRLFKSNRLDYKNGDQKRDFIYVLDVVKVILFFLAHDKQSGIFNVGTGQARSFNDMANAVFGAFKKDPHVLYIPMPKDLKGKYQYHTEADITKLRKAGYKASFWSLEEGTYDYIKKYLEPRYGG